MEIVECQVEYTSSGRFGQVAEKQAEGVPITADGVGAGIQLRGQMTAEERRHEF